MMEPDDVAKHMSNWNWKYFFQVCDALGVQFNDASWRMMKGEVMCTALEQISNNSSEYVDEVGYDLTFMDKKIEVKTEKRIIKKNLDTKSIQLKNTRGVIQQFKKTFDYLLIINTEAPFMAALTTWDEVNKKHLLKGDQIQCVIESENLMFLTPKSGVIIDKNVKSSNSLKDYMRVGIKKWISEIEEDEYVTKPSDARISPRLPVTYSDLDIRSKGEFRELQMWVSGVKAKGYIDHNHSSRVRILFLEPQSLFQEQDFVTKYFNLDAPGHLVWGKDDENLWILEHRDI